MYKVFFGVEYSMEWVHGVLVTKGYVLGQFTVASAPTKRAMEYMSEFNVIWKILKLKNINLSSGMPFSQQ